MDEIDLMELINIFHVPIDIDKWNFFEKVEGPGHIETFRATKDMEEGDILVLYVTENEKGYRKGVYGFAIVTRERYYLENKPYDILNENYVVDGKITHITKDEPFINFFHYKNMVNNYRTPNKIVDGDTFVKILNTILEINKANEEESEEDLEEKKKLEEEIEIERMRNEAENRKKREQTLIREKAEISNGSEEIIQYVEGGKYKAEINVYRRSKEIRDKVVELHGTKCEICGFDFFEEYGEWGRDYIEVHHIKPISTWKEEREVDIENDFICLCANCHKMIHRRRNQVLTPNELIIKRVLKTDH